VITQAYSPEDVAQFHALVDDAQRQVYLLRAQYRCGQIGDEDRDQRYRRIVLTLGMRLSEHIAKSDDHPAVAIAELLVSAAGAL
jgi:hypothetical protein